MNRRSLLKAFALVGAAPSMANAEIPQNIAEILPPPMPDLFQGSGWYTHKERVGTLSVYKIVRKWSDMDREWYYVAKAWPAQHSYADHLFSKTEVNAFIHGPAEWVPDGTDLVWAGAWTVRREG